MLCPCETPPLALVIRIKSLSSLFTAQHLSYCSLELHGWLGSFSPQLCGRFNFFSVYVCTYPCRCRKEKIAVPRCFEAIVAYIQLRLNRKKLHKIRQALQVHYSIGYLINLSCLLDNKTPEYNFRNS